MKKGIVPTPDQFETGVPRASAKAAAKAKTSTPGVKSGQLGQRYDGKLGGAEGNTEPMLTLVEFDGVRSVTVQLHQQTRLPPDDPLTVPQPDLSSNVLFFNYDDTPEDTDPGGIAPNAFRFSTDKLKLYLSKDATNQAAWDLEEYLGGATKIRLWFSAELILTIGDDIVERADDYEIPLGGFGASLASLPGDGFLTEVYGLTPQPPATYYPNASARAVVRVRSGQAGEIEFECDWAAKFEVLAQTIEIDRRSFRPNGAKSYVDTTVSLKAAVSLEGAGSSFAPVLTMPPLGVSASNGERTYDIPQLARRVSLLTKYPDAPGGDVPLAQIFLAFATPFEGAMGYIDALSARDALFGDGMPIPHGAYQIVLTNASPTDLYLGLLFHLGL